MNGEQERREAEFRRALAHCAHLGYDREETVRHLAETFPSGYTDGYEDARLQRA